MRSEQEMFDLILNTARQDERIRAVILNGSRTNPNAIKDIFQDYDILYVVKETKSFRNDKNWIDRFGERLYMQYPEESVYYPSDVENCYGWLIQFTDGNRLDLHVCTLSHALKEIEEDKLSKILLDKEEWNKFLKTYPSGNIQDIWEAVFVMCDLFNKVAKEISFKMNITYNKVEADNGLKFLKDVSLLPKDAKEIYLYQ